MTTISPYVEIAGLVLTGNYSDPARLHVTYSGLVTPSAGGIKIDEYNYPNRNYATGIHSGRQLRKYTVEVASMVRSDIDTFCDYVNNAPLDSEFYPESSDRCGYIQIAHAETTKPGMASYNGVWGWWYKALAEITIRGAWLYGPDQGLPLTANVTAWQTLPFTNNGNLPAGLDYLLASGDYPYAQNFAVNTYLSSYSERQGYILLCAKLMRNDRFELDRWGEVNHQYSTNFPMQYSDLQIDLQGSTYMNWGTGGSIGLNALHIGNNGKIIFPFWGPLPISMNPYIEVWVTAIEGTPKVQFSYESDLSGLPGWYSTLVLGYNKIYIPYCQGHSNLFMGITTDGASTITMSTITGMVKRYIAPSSMFLLDPGMSFYITVTAQ